MKQNRPPKPDRKNLHAGSKPPGKRSHGKETGGKGARGNSLKPKSGRRSGGNNASGTESLLLYGMHTVRAALKNPNRRKIKLYVTENAVSRLGEALLASSSVEMETRPARSLDQLVGAEAVHQGVVLECLPLDTLDASELFNLADAKIILVLDQITDPHNAGAILRSATALGVDAVLTTSRNSAQETAVMAKSASGALDLIPLVQLRNLSKGLQELNDMGFTSIGLDSEGPLVLEETLKESRATQVALVLGSEGKGLRQQTRETCSALARIDMPGPIKSLNVSNAAILSLYVVAGHLRASSR